MKTLYSIFVTLALMVAIHANAMLSGKSKPNAAQKSVKTVQSSKAIKTKTTLPPQDAATFYYLEGIKASAAESDNAKAFQLFKMAVEQDSTHAPSFYEIGRLLSASPKGLPFSQRAVALDSTNIWYQYQLAESYMNHQLYDSALVVCKRIVRTRPNDMEVHKHIAVIYDILGSPFAAIALLDSIELKFGNSPIIGEYKKELFIKTRMYDRAITENQLLVENSPLNDDYLCSLAELYALKNADSLAEDTYLKAIGIDSTNIKTLTSMSDFYLTKKEYSKFLSTIGRIFKTNDLPADVKIKYFNEVVKKDNFYREYYFQVDQLASIIAIKYPENREVSKFYGAHLIYSGRLDEALKIYKTHAADTTRDIEVFNNILGIESYKKNLDSVLVYSNMALKAFPNNIDLYTARASAFYSMEMFPEAIKVMKESLKHAKTDSVKGFVLGFIGDIYNQTKQMKQAYNYYGKSLKHDPENIMVLNNYSYNLSEEGRELERALAMSAKVIEQESGNATYLDTYAWILYKLKRYPEAREVMQKAVSLDNTNSKELLLHYGDILYQTKEYFKASIYWRKALEKGYEAKAIEERLELIKGK